MFTISVPGLINFSSLFCNVQRMSLDVFNCLPTTPPDGNTYMAGMLQYPCGGSTQLMLLPLALVSFAAYSVALPAAGLWFVRAKRDVIK
jgi:hypothetical protein